jgi:hypothetical protein
MTKGQEPNEFDEPTQRAITELRATISQKYPGTVFQVGRAEDDPSSIHITAIVDVDDPDEVGDLVLDRVLELQVDEGIPIHVIPIRTPERVMAELQEQLAGSPARPRRTIPLLGGLPLGSH